MEVIKIKISILPPIGLSLSVTPPIGIKPTIPTADQGKLVIEGKPGKTPFIGENGNWWIGEVDTEVYARGAAIIDEGAKYSSLDAGSKGQQSFDDDFLYMCVESGTAGNARWKRIPLKLI